MAMQGDGHRAIAVMWALTGLVFVFVILRAYTRVFLVHWYGTDDHVYIVSFFFLMFNTICTTIAGHYGFGQDTSAVATKDPELVINAVLFESIGQTFAVLGMALAKWSLGLFLLRIVLELWHKIAIWGMMCILMGTSIATVFVFWFQCKPIKYLWDPRGDGECHVDVLPVGLLLGVICVLTDLFFALFPWIILRNLQINKQKKMVILASMSLGVVAAACGIKRCTEVPELATDNYLKETVGIIVWSAAEMAVTLICIGIPVIRPIYKPFLDKWTSHNRSKYKDNSGQISHNLRTISGSTMPGATREGAVPATDAVSDASTANDAINRRIGIGPFTKSYAVGGRGILGDNHSDESILGPEFRQGQRQMDEDALERGIGITKEYHIMSERTR